MKCPNCGAELSEDSRFCSYCGSKIEDTVSDESGKKSHAEDNENSTGPVTNSVTPKSHKVSKGKSKKKGVTSKNKRDLYGKILIVFLIVFGIFCAVAFILDNVAAEIVSVLQIALTIVSIIMYKRIKSIKKWFNIIPFILAFLLSVIYVLIVAADYDNSKKIVWSDITLSELVPETQSLYGEIVSNSDNSMLVYINRTSESEYNDYVEACKDYGFTVDPEENSYNFFAYDDDGNELSLSYYSSSESIHINLSVAEEYGEFEWPDSGLACLIPVPESLTGEIINNDETWFRVYVSEISLESYNEYVSACIEYGFANEINEIEKS